MTKYIIRASLSNGFKSMVDFVDEENRDEVKKSWKNYYASLGVKASITSEKAGLIASDAMPRQLNKHSFNAFGKAWNELDQDHKLSIIEMMLER